MKDNDDKVDQLENCNTFLADILVDSPAAHESGGEVLDASTDKDSISSNDTDDDPKEKKHSNVMEPVAGWLRGAFLLSIEALRIMRVAIKYEKVVKVLVINANSGPGLLFPKGGWENDETVEEAAAREALEEAGVGGDLLVRKSELILPFDCSSIFWDNTNSKAKPSNTGLVQKLYGLCKASMFALLVKEELDPMLARTEHSTEKLADHS